MIESTMLIRLRCVVCGVMMLLDAQQVKLLPATHPAKILGSSGQTQRVVATC